jgi:hypothetical protein
VIGPRYGAERRAERGASLARWIALGCSVGRLWRLDRRVRHAAATDWPGRTAGPELRQGVPDPGDERWREEADDGRA